jgi:hypothetical protein
LGRDTERAAASSGGVGVGARARALVLGVFCSVVLSLSEARRRLGSRVPVQQTDRLVADVLVWARLDV